MADLVLFAFTLSALFSSLFPLLCRNLLCFSFHQWFRMYTVLIQLSIEKQKETKAKRIKIKVKLKWGTGRQGLQTTIQTHFYVKYL